MAKIRKIGSEYFVEYYAQGLKFAKRGGRELEYAEKLKKEIEASYPEKIEDIYTVRDDSIDDFLKAFRQFAKTEFPEATLKHYVTVLNHFEDFLNHHLSSARKIKELTPKLINDYNLYLLQLRSLNPRKVKPAMINFTLYILKDILEYAIALRSLNDNPCNHVALMAVSQKRKPRILDEKNRKLFLSECDVAYVPIIHLILSSGLSADEAAKLKWDDIDFAKNEIYVTQIQEEKEVSRVIPMDFIILDIFKRGLREKRNDFVFPDFDKNRFQAQITDVSQKTGIFLNYQVLRNTFIAGLLQKRVSWRKIISYVGWNDVARLMRFESYFMSSSKTH